MKNFKKMMALVIAMVMVIGSFNVFAATGERTVDTSISIGGLEEGDIVKLYKVIGWEDSVGWVVEDDFDGISIQTAIEANEPISIDTGVMNEINSKVTASMTPANGTSGGNPTGGTYTWPVPENEEGMYIAIVTPAKAGVVYSPIIVSADYDPTSSTSIDASNDSIPGSAGVNNQAVAKKSEVTLTKTGDSDNDHDGKDPETVKVGDVVTFTVTTTIPPFAGYNDPSFDMTDAMSSGLKYDQTSGITLVEPTSAAGNYSVTGESDTGYTITFDHEYLKGIATATTFTYTYKATVTTDAVSSVNPENNTITLTYNNNPNDSSSKTKLRDRTNHYTFTIDGTLLGNDNYSATEVVKIGLSADGTEVNKTTVLSNGNSVAALEEAEFALYAVDDDVFTAALGGTFDQTGKTAYSNKDKDGNEVSYANFKSGADGRITISGIDGGKYVLVETKAPAGYIKQTKPVCIEIIPTINTSVSYDEEIDENGVKYPVKITTTELVSYIVKIDGVETASYTIKNSADPEAASSNEGDTVVGGATDDGKIKNTQGVELPSTGGMGTTLFYAIGAILVLGAGVLLVSKRRMAAN